MGEPDGMHIETDYAKEADGVSATHAYADTGNGGEQASKQAA